MFDDLLEIAFRILDLGCIGYMNHERVGVLPSIALTSAKYTFGEATSKLLDRFVRHSLDEVGIEIKLEITHLSENLESVLLFSDWKGVSKYMRGVVSEPVLVRHVL